MTQLASTLTVATVSVGFLTLIATFNSQRRRRHILETKLPMLGVFAGHYSINVSTDPE